ncbi:MAG: XdhC family protein [Candidatus Omnitrophica bacterium]|nr:XdhC family protein [Candidatus Omnitrophota bacterium]
MEHHLLIKAYNAALNNQQYAIATVVDTTLKGTPQKPGAKMIVLQDGTIMGTIGGGRNEKSAQKECLKVIKSGKPKIVTYDYFGKKGQSICGGQMSVFIEPYRQPRDFIMCGGGHIALPLTIIAKMLRFRVILIDNRKDFANKHRFSHADQIICGTYASSLNKLKISRNSYIMVDTQGNEHDYTCLKKLINEDYSYLGIISSKAKKIKFFNRLKNEKKCSEHLFKKIHIPAGIDIGALTPQEIAVSIAGQIIKIVNKENIGTAKFK